jgi:hypothetical protein
VNFTADDRGTLFKGEYVAHERFSFSKYFYDVSNLNYRVLFGDRELALASRTFNVKTQYAQRCDLREFALNRERDHMVVIIDVKLNLAVGSLLHVRTSQPVLGFHSDPGHASNLIVYHKSESVRQVALVSS